MLSLTQNANYFVLRLDLLPAFVLIVALGANNYLG